MANQIKFPSKVKPAYVPSGKWGGFIFTFIYSILALIIAYLLMATGTIASSIMSLLFIVLPICFWIVLIIAIIVMLIVPFLPAIIISKGAAMGAKEDKSRSFSEVFSVSLLVLFGGYILPIFFVPFFLIIAGTDALPVDFAFAGSISGCLALVIGIINVVILYKFVKDEIREMYFSEDTDVYLKKQVLETYKLFQGNDLIQVLTNREFFKLKEFEKPHKDSKNKAELVIWTAEGSSTIYLELILNGEILGESVKNHLVFSKQIDKTTLSEIKSSLG